MCVAVASCEKPIVEDIAPGQEGQKSQVVITIADIESGWASATRAQVSVADVCSRVQFAIYQNGTRVEAKNQAAGDDGFGTLTLQLDAGDYQLLVLAHSSKANITTTSPAKLAFTNPGSSNGTGYSDTFYYYGTMSVTDGETRVSIDMKRATSMFRLVTTDVKPAEVKRLQFYYEGGSGALDATTGFGCVKSKQSVFVDLDDSQTGKPLQIDMYTFLHAETGSVDFTVKAFNAADDIVYSHEFSSVSMQRNCITRYTGKFFVSDQPDQPDQPDDPEPDTPSPLVVMVDPDWASTFDYTF